MVFRGILKYTIVTIVNSYLVSFQRGSFQVTRGIFMVFQEYHGYYRASKLRYYLNTEFRQRKIHLHSSAKKRITKLERTFQFLTEDSLCTTTEFNSIPLTPA